MKIEKYINSDKKECLSLYVSNFGEHWSKDGLKDFDKFIDEESSSLCKIEAVLDDEIVGFLGFRYIEDFVWIEWVIVHKSEQGKRVGKTLVERAIDKVEGKTVRLASTKNTLEFYKKCSFEIE